MTTRDRLYTAHQPRFAVAPMMDWAVFPKNRKKNNGVTILV
ncbi:hypothetical protein [Roseibium sp. MB-4]